MTTRWSSCVHGPGLLMLVFLLVGSARAQQAPMTDPIEAALIAMLVKLELMVPVRLNSENPCANSPKSTDDSTFEDDYGLFFTCDCSAYSNTICHITKLIIRGLNAVGPIPEELRNLTHLTQLDLGQNYLTGPLPSFLGELSAMPYMSLGMNALSETVPKELGNLTNLVALGFDSNNLSGSLPWELGNLAYLEQLDFSCNQLSGNFPFWSNYEDLQLNLVANNFMINSSTNKSALPWQLECLQPNAPCFLGSPQSTSLAVDCGSSVPPYGSDTSTYQPDDAHLGPASYCVIGTPIWGVSNVGMFMDALNGSYIIHSSRRFQNTVDSKLFETARMSPSSLRFYGVGLNNGIYTVTLQFAELGFEDSQTWNSLGRRVFDIYVQGERKEQNFDIRKAARGKSYIAVKKQYIVPVELGNLAYLEQLWVHANFGIPYIFLFSIFCLDY